MNRIALLAAVAATSLSFTVGCASKNYVRNETTPTINKVNELDELTAKTTKDIRDVDARAQQGIQGVNAKAGEADQKAQAAGKTADEANTLAMNASQRVTSLTNQVINLDQYKPVVETQVHFGFDKYHLTDKAKSALDQLGAELPNAKHYIVVVDGNTDSVGPTEYNYKLSQRRADAVIQYLASKYQVPAHKIYVIGLGEDKPLAQNNNGKGRAENRRVDVRLMTNVVDQNNPTSAQNASMPQQH
jgi:outer membrane protein OmpA-like peptidoglycan-associated protein